MGSAETQGALWGRAPSDWAELQEPMHAPLWNAMLDAANVGRGTRLCDVGCGGGGASVLAAQRGAIVSGIDAAGPLIDVASSRLPDADFRVGDMERLPFPDAAFDAVIAASSIQYSADRAAALRELKRTCRRDGRIAIGLWGPPDMVAFRHVFKAVADALPEPPPGKGPFELSEPGMLKDMAADAGLTVIADGDVACPFEYDSFETFWKANVSAGPLQAALGSVSESKLAATVRAALQPFVRPDGSMRFENMFQYVVAVP